MFPPDRTIVLTSEDHRILDQDHIDTQLKLYRIPSNEDDQDQDQDQDQGQGQEEDQEGREAEDLQDILLLDGGDITMGSDKVQIGRATFIERIGRSAH